MLFIPIEHLKEGMIVGKDVFGTLSANHSTVLLISRGQPLSQKIIDKLNFYQIAGLYINHPGTEDIEVEEIIPTESRIEAISCLKTVFNNIDTSNYISFIKNMKEVKAMVNEFINYLLAQENVMVNMITLKNHDDCTFNHSLNVSILSLAMGIHLNFTQSQLEDLGLAAILHDIGKVEIPINVLNKPGKLTTEEFDLIKTHPEIGRSRLVESKITSFVICWAVQAHHERYDGSGYPLGFKGEQIPYFARILAIADVYDALTSVRPYRKPEFPNDALEYIMSCSGTHFDPELLTIFLKVVVPYPVGVCVALSNGAHGVVTAINKAQPMRPVVRLLDTGQELDLLNDPNLFNLTITGVNYEGLPDTRQPEVNLT